MVYLSCLIYHTRVNMSNSSLVTIRVPAVNYSKGRDGRVIEMITIHHMAGVLSAQRCGEIFQNTRYWKRRKNRTIC